MPFVPVSAVQATIQKEKEDSDEEIREAEIELKRKGENKESTADGRSKDEGRKWIEVKGKRMKSSRSALQTPKIVEKGSSMLEDVHFLSQ